MGTYLIKPDPDVDWYAYWSSVVDSPLAWGSKASLAARPDIGPELNPDRFERADETGTSLRHARSSWARHPTIIVYESAPESPGTLRLADLRAFCEHLEAGRNTEAQALLTPFDDEDDQ